VAASGDQERLGRERAFRAGPRKRGDLAATAAAYLALALFGLAQGLLGAFFYASGTVPLTAIGFGVAIGATCVLGGWGTRSPAGGVASAVGWFAVVFLLATGTSEGSVLITATAAGEWFLFGGSACAAIGVVACFVKWSRPAQGRSSWRRSGS
jgi:hypothetical protein